MALKLNLPYECIKINDLKIPFYKGYPGQNIIQMPLLIADGRVPMNTAQLLQRRLEVRNAESDVRSAYVDYIAFNTGDGLAYHPDGRFKIVLDSQNLREMTIKNPIKYDALEINEDVYKTLEGEEFKKGKLGKVNDGLSRADVKAHPVWKVLARDQALLNDYTDWAFIEYRDRFAQSLGVDDIKIMQVYPDLNRDTRILIAWSVYCLEDYGFSISGKLSPFNLFGYLIGVMPGKGTSNIKTCTMADLQDVSSAINGLEEVVD